jgi:capsule biosynthesis phosphatase
MKNINKKKIICFDIDNVICKTNSLNQYNKSIPIKKNINLINQIYKKGFKVVLYTARFMGRCNGNLTEVKKKNNLLTIRQLKKWKVNYHKIYFGKPSFDLFIDDKALFFKKNWAQSLKKKLRI